MNISCPTCTQRLQVPDDAAGKKVSCPKCAQRILVPPPPRPTPAPVNKTMLGKIEEGVSAAKAPVSPPTPSSAAVTIKPPIPFASFADLGKPTPQPAPTIPVIHVHGERSAAAHSLGIASLVLGC